MAIASLHDLPPSNDPQALLAQSDASQSGLPVAVFPIPGSGTVAQDHHATARIFVAHQGRGVRCYRRAGRVLDLHTAPRMIEVYEAGLHFEQAQWQGEAGRCVRIEFTDEQVCQLTHGELQTLRLRTQHELFDDKLSSLTLELAHELICHGTASALYLQGLTLSILGLVCDRYSDQAPLSARTGCLTPVQRRRVIELLDAEFASKVSIAQIAAEVGLSAHHFARLFKATFGVTPHEHVVQLRLDAAERALRSQGGRSISEIAIACGFSSQLHLTQALRQRRGVTPNAMRRDTAGSRAQRQP